MKENMKEEDEFEMLLGEIPHATSSLNLQTTHSSGHNQHNNVVDHGHASYMIQKANGHGHGMYEDELFNHQYYTSASSPLSGFSVQSHGSSSSLFSGSPSPPQIEDLLLKPHSNRFCTDFRKGNETNFVDDFNLSRDFSKMYITDEQESFPVSSNGVQSFDNLDGAFGINFEKYGACNNYSSSSPDYRGFNLSVPRTPSNLNREISSLLEMRQNQGTANSMGSQYSPRMVNRFEYGNSTLIPQFGRSNLLADNNFQMGFASDASSNSNRRLLADSLFYGSFNGYLPEGNGSFSSPNMVIPHYNEESSLNYQPPLPNSINMLPSCIRVPQGRVETCFGDDSLIIQGGGTNYGVKRQSRPSRESGAKTTCPLPLPLKFGSLAEVKGYIYQVAKDQHGCRFLQRVFEEGSFRDVQIIFNEIIEHVDELMMNPFGNYLMQKLLEVCNEEQRTNILLRVTEEPGELVRISLNTHGTRVVQKLIETLKTRQQILIVISALEPAFLALIKDLNGNHVVQKCLQCFSNENSKFIFVAAAKYCVEIATHQHGCCVLQSCISYSTGEYRDNLVAQISKNGYLLAQDAFGNYAVQFILDLKIPSALSKLTSQFENNYVHLSSQKFSSHVVEKCLVVCNDYVRSRIIYELLSASHFDQLLQDPHANYVIQTALRVTEGRRLHNSLLEAIESYKAVSRNSPYSKRIFSHKFLRR